MYIKYNLNSFLEEININSNRTYKPRNQTYSIINTQYARAKVKYYKYKTTLENKKFVELNIEEQSKLLELRKVMREKDKLKALTPSIMKDQKLIKVSYVRYADDFLILTNANRKMTTIIKTKLEEFLQSKLNLELSKDKTLITNLKTTPAKFLGFSIKTYPKRSFSITKELAYTKKSGWNLTIDVDLDQIQNRLKLRGFLNLKGKPVAKRPWSVLHAEEILNRYNYMFRGLGNYDFPVVDRLSRISTICYYLKFSCLSTLAKKFKSKITKITKKYGDPLVLNIQELITTNKGTKQIDKTYTLLNYLTLKELLHYKKFNFKTFREKQIQIAESDIFRPLKTINWRTYKNLENVCAICGTDKNVEQHHVKHIKVGKVIGFSQVMKQLNRRMIPLCHTHHQEVQKGKYDGIKIQDLIDI